MSAADEVLHDFFVSYGARADYASARRIKLFLERLPEELRSSQLPRFRVCVDDSDFQRGPQLEAMITNSLVRSKRMLVLCSTAATASESVSAELAWFLENKAATDLFVAVTEATSAVTADSPLFPEQIRDRGLSRALWYDLRALTKAGRKLTPRPWQDTLTQLAAHSVGETPSAWLALWQREARRRRRVRWIAVGVVVAALLTSLLFFVQSRKSAAVARVAKAQSFLYQAIKDHAAGDTLAARAGLLKSLELSTSGEAERELAEIQCPIVYPAGRSKAKLGALHGIAALPDSSVVVIDAAGVVERLRPDQSIAWRVELPSAATAVAATHDDVFVAFDKTLERLDPATGAVRSKTALRGTPLGLAISPDGTRAALGFDGDAGLDVVSLDDGTTVFGLENDTGEVQGITFSPDGRYVYWGGSGEYVWACEAVPDGHCDPLNHVTQYVYAIENDPAGRRTYVAVGDTLRVFDHELEQVYDLPVGEQAYAIATLPGSGLVIVGDAAGSLTLFDVNARRAVQRMSGHSDVRGIIVHPSGIVSSCGMDGLVLDWNVRPYRWSAPPHGEPRSLPTGSLTAPQEDRIVGLDRLGAALLVTASTGHQFVVDPKMLQTTDVPGALDPELLASNMNRRAHATYYGVIPDAWTVWKHLAIGPTVVPALDSEALPVAISPDGTRLAWAKDRTLTIETKSGEPSTIPFTSPLSALVWLTPGTLLCADETGVIWKVLMQSPAKQQLAKVAEGPHFMLAIDATSAVIMMSHEAVRLDLATNRIGPHYQARGMLSGAVADDGSIFAAGTADGDVRLFDIRAGTLLVRWSGHRGEVPTVLFSADGMTVYSGGQDETLRAWDVRLVKSPTTRCSTATL